MTTHANTKHILQVMHFGMSIDTDDENGIKLTHNTSECIECNTGAPDGSDVIVAFVYASDDVAAHDDAVAFWHPIFKAYIEQVIKSTDPVLIPNGLYVYAHKELVKQLNVPYDEEHKFDVVLAKVA